MYPASYSPRSRAVEIDDAGLRVPALLSPATWNLAVQITAPGQTYTVDINAGTGPEIRIDWGDGVVEMFTTTGLKTHTYTLVKTFTVKLSGRFSSGGNIRLGSDTGNRARMVNSSAIPLIPGLLNFNATFMNCTGFKGPLVADFFRYNPKISTYGFSSTFSGCSGLTGSIPTDLFRYNTLVSTYGFYYTFYGCSGLTDAPADLFRYNVLADSFDSCFRNCVKFQQNANLFYAAGEQSTRFLNKTVNFANCFRISSFSGTQGVAPDLWACDFCTGLLACDFGTGTATKTDCWQGHSIASVANFADIPADWT